MPIAEVGAVLTSQAHRHASTILEYRKDQRIYQRDKPPGNIYLVMSGKVLLYRYLASGYPTVIDVISDGGIFGESALLNDPSVREEAVAMAETALMAWTLRDLGELEVTLCKAFAQRAIECTHRIASLSIDAVDQRLAWSLLRLAERLGSRQADGTIHIMPLTHEFLAQYIGTGRETVTRAMIRFRRQGYLRYSRQAIVIADSALTGWLEGSARDRRQPKT